MSNIRFLQSFFEVYWYTQLNLLTKLHKKEKRKTFNIASTRLKLSKSFDNVGVVFSKENIKFNLGLLFLYKMFKF